MSSVISLFVLQVALYSIFPFYLARLNKPTRSAAFYIYISLVLMFGGLSGAILSLPITESITISSGNIAYGALMMTSILFVILERDLFIFRGILRLVISVNIFKILLFSTIAYSLNSEDIINPYHTDVKIFNISIPFVILGGFLIVTELLALIYIFEKIKLLSNSNLIQTTAYLLSFIIILCLDGVLFPTIAFGFSPKLIDILIGGVTGKFIMASAFCFPMGVFFYIYKDNLKLYTETSPFNWELLTKSSERIMKEIKESEEKLKQASTVFEHTNEGVVLTDRNFNIINFNSAFKEITSNHLTESIGYINELLKSNNINIKDITKTIESDNYWKEEVFYVNKLNKKSAGLISITSIKNTSNSIINFVIFLTDITEIRETQEKLLFLANHDQLTGLSNRRVLLNSLEQSVKTAARNHNKPALLVMDLDHFKDVNDSYGHQVGDELLKEVGNKLAKEVRDSDTLCRLGGDEFAILVNHTDNFEGAAHIANSIINSLTGAWKLNNGAQVHVGGSIGISLYPEHGNSANLLMQNADAALYKAKKNQRGTIEFFTTDMTVASRYKIEMEMRLRHCIENDHLEVFFQPQVDISTGLIFGAEALVRWNDPLNGYIQPTDFIPQAEATGLIEEIGKIVLRKTCIQGKKWTDLGHEPLQLSVNLSPYQLRHGNIFKTVTKILHETGFPPTSLELELTESALIEREDQLIPVLNSLRALGIRIAIDDFGTGYSSLSYLRRFPIDTLKIDKSFIDDLVGSENEKELVSTIILMGKKLGFHVIAEGVETEHQLSILDINKCNSYQGYLKSPPLPADDFIKLCS